MEGLIPVTMAYLVNKAENESNANLLIIWKALQHVDLGVPYSESNPDISMLDWTLIVQSVMDRKGLLK